MKAVIALGSNLENRRLNLDIAITKLEELLAIEDEMGRVREVHWGPRIIDLDLIVHGDQVIDTVFLKLPHPLAASREFVLEPWLSIDPDGEIPGKGSIKSLLASIRSAS